MGSGSIVSVRTGKKIARARSRRVRSSLGHTGSPQNLQLGCAAGTAAKADGLRLAFVTHSDNHRHDKWAPVAERDALMRSRPCRGVRPVKKPSVEPVKSDRERTEAILAGRPAEAPVSEASALHKLTVALATSPEDVLELLTMQTMVLCNAGSAGVSLRRSDGSEGFYWPAIAGAWSPFVRGGMPLDASPCGRVVSENATLLFETPAERFPTLRGAEPPIEEVLLAPFHVHGEPFGTVWALSHDSARRFTREDARLLQSLARFASAAYSSLPETQNSGGI